MINPESQDSLLDKEAREKLELYATLSTPVTLIGSSKTRENLLEIYKNYKSSVCLKNIENLSREEQKELSEQDLANYIFGLSEDPFILLKKEKISEKLYILLSQLPFFSPV